ncbi:hypothetical protein POJ06DRAFT_107957 [Lipomyces tetrasporus]|uniref:Uncharacterized protein n=1 Tax=Lipomyces tetrasporus TaxID=54092 RepID=A0AAD7VTD0_9ASCO|nr:uncharacterized protein POJ06DRAFT_107957 [Lipomyces tetrasporus]KAJ8100599.1 hypothetical protein POJ06DRAFT_107957 [Lipomyces tetrasporus]
MGADGHKKYLTLCLYLLPVDFPLFNFRSTVLVNMCGIFFLYAFLIDIFNPFSLLFFHISVFLLCARRWVRPIRFSVLVVANRSLALNYMSYICVRWKNRWVVVDCDDLTWGNYAKYM